MTYYYTKVHLSKYNGSWVVSTKQTMNFNIKTAAIFVFFVSDKNGLIKSCTSFEDLSVYKMSWSHVDWCKFCIQLRSLNARHFGTVEGTGLKSTASRSPSMAWPLYWISWKTNQLVQKLLGGDTQIDRQTDRRTEGQTGDLISLSFLLKESRLKTILFYVARKETKLCTA
jgi:hypothetical protein